MLVAAAGAGALALATRLEAPAWSGGGEATVEGRITELRRSPSGYFAVLRDVARVDPGPALPRSVVLRGDEARDPFDHGPGERIRARLRLRAPPGPRNPGGRDRRRELARRGIHAEARLVHPSLHVAIAAPAGPGLALRSDRLRSAAARRLLAAGPGAELLAGLGLGRRDGLAPESRDALARLGLSHLLAVSGLHLALVAGAVFAAARRLASRSTRLAARVDPRRLALALALPAAALYAGLAGWGIPVRRALLCLVALAWGFLLRRPGPPLQPLAGAALLVLAVDPAALFAPGAQMSFAASAALVTARPVERGARGPRGLLAATAAAIASTAPLAAHHFGAAPAAGLVGNLLAVPWTAVVLLPLALAASGLAMLGPEAAWVETLLEGARLPADWSLRAARRAAAALPAVPPAPPAPAWALLVASGSALVALRTRSLARRVAVAALLGAALVRVPPPALEPALPRVVVLDVGQGDAVLVQGRRAAVLVDAGARFPGGGDRGRDVVLPALAALGVRRLDLVVASHADLDHRGGLTAVLEGLPVGELWLPAGSGAEAGFAGLREAARARGLVVRERGQGDPPRLLDGLRVTPLWPPRRSPSGGASRNDRSLVLRVEVGGRRVLLPGDLEAGGEAGLLASGADLAAHVLKLGHHGSRTSSSAAFLAAVGAEWAVASAPRAGRFGMPHAEVRTRVAAAGTRLAWTGRDGAVLVGLGPRLGVRGWALGGPIEDAPDRR